ncbi:MAG: dihydropteroate synthase, partial [Desulfonatronovibrio sp.]
MKNKIVQWNVKGGGTIGPSPFLIAGILNVTPDSFYDGGRYADVHTAIDRVETFLEQGADIIDIGGESTRPFSQKVEQSIELQRVVPIVKKILERHSHANVSIDTYKAKVAEESLKAGAVIVNDVSACRYDPELVRVLCDYKPGYVLMHSQGTPESMQKSPEYGDVVGDIKAFFHERLSFLEKQGLPVDRIVLDPGIGFGKTMEHNLEILTRIQEFLTFGLPLYLGISNKSVWGKFLGLDTDSRETATQVGVALTGAR